MPVTTIKLEGTLASKNNMNDMIAKTIEKFEQMLSAERCQIINVNMGDESRGLIGRKQVITIIWSGSSSNIQSTYTAYPNYGLFGVLSSVNLAKY